MGLDLSYRPGCPRVPRAEPTQGWKGEGCGGLQAPTAAEGLIHVRLMIGTAHHATTHCTTPLTGRLTHSLRVWMHTAHAEVERSGGIQQGREQTDSLRAQRSAPAGAQPARRGTRQGGSGAWLGAGQLTLPPPYRSPAEPNRSPTGAGASQPTGARGGCGEGGEGRRCGAESERCTSGAIWWRAGRSGP